MTRGSSRLTSTAPEVSIIYGRARCEHRIRQRIHAFLQQRFTAGDFDQVASVAANYFDDFGYRHPPSFIECVLGVAPFASQVASCFQPHKARMDGPLAWIHPGCCRKSR